jgi:methionine-rich copper-binding protein CopC
VVIGATVEDSAGNPITAANATFTTVQETTGPTVSSVYPADNQNGVSISDNISVTFSEAMDSTYVTTSTSDTNCAGNIWVSSVNFSSCVRMSSEPASSNSNMTFTLDPHDNLTVGTTYKTRVTTGVKDTAGNSMSSQYETSSGFTPADLTAPTVTSVSTTADNQSSVAITDNITLTFSEAMDSTSVTTNTGDTSCSGTLGVSSDNFSSCVQMSSFPARSNDNMTFTIDPSDNLTGGTTYLTRVTTGVKDSAGNTLSSQYVTSSGFTTADYALNFDGTNDYVSIPNDPFSNNNTFTIQAWLKPEAVGDGAYHGFVGIQTTSGRKPSLWVNTDGNLHYDSYKGSQRFTGTISDGSNKFFTVSEWVHVGWTNDGSNYKFYKNGNLVATETAPDTFYALDNIGYQIGKVDNYFKGQIDEVAIWDVALGSANITALYNSGIGLKASVDSGNYDKSGDLVGYWQFNEGTGSALTDNTLNSNNGTLNNMDSNPWVTSGLNLTN